MARCHKDGKVYLYPKIVVGMTDRDVIERAALLLGGNKVYPIPFEKRGRAKKQQYRAAVSGWKAAALMRQMRPWLGERRGMAVDRLLTEWDARELTEIRRRQSCSEAAAKRKRRSNGTFEPIT